MLQPRDLLFLYQAEGRLPVFPFALSSPVDDSIAGGLELVEHIVRDKAVDDNVAVTLEGFVDGGAVDVSQGHCKV